MLIYHLVPTLPADSNDDGSNVGHAGGVLTGAGWSHGHGRIVGVITEHRHVAGAQVAEHRVEDGDTVGSDDADTTELLDKAHKHYDQEWLVDLWVAPQVPHVVTLSLFVTSAARMFSVNFQNHIMACCRHFNGLKSNLIAIN